MENIIDLKNPRKQKSSLNYSRLIFVKNMDFVQIVYSKNG